MKCMHSVTDEHGAKMICAAEGSEVVILNGSPIFPPRLQPARSYWYFCPNHIGIHSDDENLIAVTTAEMLNGHEHPDDCLLCQAGEPLRHTYTPPAPVVDIADEHARRMDTDPEYRAQHSK